MKMSEIVCSVKMNQTGSTFRAKGQHAEGLPSDNNFLHNDAEAVDISGLGARFAQRRIPEQFWSSPQQI
jgi:hypothetical protein